MNEGQTEGVLLMATPETNFIDARRNSTGEVATRASSSHSNSEGKNIPHYLRTSIGSCHDFCKNGRQHTFESKGRNPTFHRYSRSGSSSAKGQYQVPSLGEKQKKSAAKQKRAAHPEIGLCDRPKTSGHKAFSPLKTIKPIQESEINKDDATCHERSGSSEFEIKWNFPSTSKEINPLEGFETIERGAAEKIGSFDDTETTIQGNPTFLKKTGLSTDSHERKPSSHKVHLCPEPASSEQRTQSAKGAFSSAKSKVEQKAPSTVKKAISPGKAKVSKQVSSLPANRFDASARPALPGKSNVALVKSESQLNHGSGMSGRNFGRKVVKNDLSKPRGKKILKSSLDCLLPQPPANHVSKSASPVKDAKMAEKSVHKTDNIREKTFHIIGQGPTDDENTESTQSKSSSHRPSPSSPSPSSTLSSSALSSSSSVSGHEEEAYPDSESIFSEACDLVSDDGGDRTNMAAEHEDKRSQRKMAIVHSEYDDQIPCKLKFRRGKILNPVSDRTDTRWLRFRQERRMGGSQSGEGEMDKISFKMKQLTCGDSNHPDPESQAVVLRHQDVQERKDTVSMLNHVIEETANKLVETKKSKVQALVGAFETIISLQERKPSTPV